MKNKAFIIRYFPDIKLSSNRRQYVASTFRDISSGIIVAFLFLMITEKNLDINKLLIGLLTAISPWYTGFK